MISIVIVSYNTKALLLECLESIAVHEPAAEVIVVDNASADGSVTAVCLEYPQVRVVALDANAGFAAANNIGLQMSDRPYAVLLNSDTVLTADSLTQCVAAMERDPALGAVHPALIGPDQQPQMCLRNFPTLGAAVSRALRRPVREDSRSETTWLAGTALILRRSALDSIGGKLDDNYFMYWEDADLSARLRRAGWNLQVIPTTTVRHYGGASGGGPDAARRADLFAWYLYGKHRWFRRNRPRWESFALWLFDGLDIPRKALRGLLNQRRRRAEWAHARVTAQVLALLLLGRSPAPLM